MISLKTNAHVGPDGTLTVAVPTPLREMDVEVMVIVQPVSSASAALTPEERGWPPGFFEATAGSLKDDPIECPSQGEYEVREAIS